MPVHALNASLPEPGADARAHSERLAALIRARDRAPQAARSRSRAYMELALYAPGLGYYSAGARQVRRRGDFVTAPELGSAVRTLHRRRCARADVARARRRRRLPRTRRRQRRLRGGRAARARRARRAAAALPDPRAQRRPARAPARARCATQLPPELLARVRLARRGRPRTPGAACCSPTKCSTRCRRRASRMRDGEVYEEHVALDAGERLPARATSRPMRCSRAAVRHVERDIDAPASPTATAPSCCRSCRTGCRRSAASLEDGRDAVRRLRLSRAASTTCPSAATARCVCHYRHRAHDDPFCTARACRTSPPSSISPRWPRPASTPVSTSPATAPQGQFLMATACRRCWRKCRTCPISNACAWCAEAKRLTLPGDMGERFQAIAFARGVEDALPGLRAFDLSRRL